MFLLAKFSSAFGRGKSNRNLGSKTDLPEVYFFHEKDCNKCRDVYNYILEPLVRHTIIHLKMIDVEVHRSPQYDWWERTTAGMSHKGTPIVKVEDMFRSNMEEGALYILNKNIDKFKNRIKNMRKKLYKDLRDYFEVSAFDHLSYHKIMEDRGKI